MSIKAKYVHTNIVAANWKRLADFYVDVFGCSIVPPERDYSGKELDAGVNIPGAHLHGVHLLLPGWGENGPTLEIYSYNFHEKKPKTAVNRPGFTHIAFEVDSVEEALQKVLASGGNNVGKIVTLTTSIVNKVTWCYLTDPEGNIIELQKWDR